MNTRITLYEIAKQAGVSISTVSRVLNHDSRKPASPETAERVQQAAIQLGYYSPLPIDPLSNSKQILCILSGRSYSYSDYVYTEILRGMQMESVNFHYRLTQILSDISIDEPILALQKEGFHYAGVILLGRITTEKVEFIKSLTSNIIYAGLNPLDYELDQVICDSYYAISEMMDYLIGLGHKRIAFLGVIPQKTDPAFNERRFFAYRDALKRHNLPLDRGLCQNIELTSERAYDAVNKMILSDSKLPDAILCSTDSCAVAAISALKYHGLKVPDDVSVVGHDGIELSSFIEPILTTVIMQKYHLGRFAALLLNDRISGKHTDPITIQLPHHLSIQQSCRKIN